MFRFSCALGEGGLEVRGHGHRQDIPLDVCTGLYPGIRGTLLASVASRNDLKGLPKLWTERTTILYCKNKKGKKKTYFHDNVSF